MQLPKEDLETLLFRVIAYDARQILIEKGKLKPAASPRVVRMFASPPDENKKKIKLIFENSKDKRTIAEEIKQITGKILESQCEIVDKKYHPGYHILLKRFLKGKYDPVSSMGIEEYAQ